MVPLGGSFLVPSSSGLTIVKVGSELASIASFWISWGRSYTLCLPTHIVLVCGVQVQRILLRLHYIFLDLADLVSQAIRQLSSDSSGQRFSPRGFLQVSKRF